MPQVSVPIVDLLTNPSLLQLQETDEGVHGPGPLSTNIAVPGTLGSVAYGVRIAAITVPAQWGVLVGNPDTYLPAIGRLALEGELGDGNSVITQLTDIGFDGQLMLWSQVIPPIGTSPVLTLHLYVAPGVTLHLRWLTAFI